MRLTLRTLLAYLDDTLEPAQASLIGQKVAESEKAQELIERIKQVTRRRRLAVPPATGPGAKIDPSTVAEYLDNELSAEKLAEVEETCLASDVHLAEIAACHQILTLVLGEPAKVPPTARQRMYGLIKGRESIPYRKAPGGVGAGKIGQGVSPDGGADAEETLLLGMRPGGWFRWVAAAAGMLVLLVVVVIVVRQALSTNEPGPVAKRVVAVNDQPAMEEAPMPVPVDEQADDGGKPQGDNDKAGGNGKKPPEKDQQPPNGQKVSAEIPVSYKPNMERRPVGKYKVETAKASVLLERQPNDREPWKRLARENVVHTGSKLVSLPGYRSEIRLESGVHLLLWGNLPEFSQVPPLLESAVTLHVPEPKADPKIDLEFTIHHGRVILSNHKFRGEAHVRLRFHNDFANPETFAFLIAALRHEKAAVREMAHKYLAYLCPDDAKKINIEPSIDPVRREELFRAWKKLIPDGELPRSLRYQPEVWDVTLKDDQCRISIEYWGVYPPAIGFSKEPGASDGPRALLVLLGLAESQGPAFRGQAELRAGYQVFALQSPCWYLWDSYNRSAARTTQLLREMPDWWPPNKIPQQTPSVRAITAAMSQLHDRLIKRDAVLDLMLAEMRQDLDPASRRLGVISLGAVDDVPTVVDALSDEQQPDVRSVATYFLHNWLARSAENDLRLFQILQDRNYTENQAEIMLSLLHGFREEDLGRPETYEVLLAYLRHEKLGVRELAVQALWLLVPEGMKKVTYDPAGETAQREAGVAAWRKLLVQKELIPDPSGKKKPKAGGKLN